MMIRCRNCQYHSPSINITWPTYITKAARPLTVSCFFLRNHIDMSYVIYDMISNMFFYFLFAPDHRAVLLADSRSEIQSIQSILKGVTPPVCKINFSTKNVRGLGGYPVPLFADKNRNFWWIWGLQSGGYPPPPLCGFFWRIIFVNLATLCPEKQNETNLKKFSFLCYY